MQAMTISEFCRQHRISRQTFYTWARAGMAPVVVAIGGSRLIFADAVVEWRKNSSKPVYYGTSTQTSCD